MFVATTQAADETEGAMCLMPDAVDGSPDAWHAEGPPKGGRHVREEDVEAGFSRTDSAYVASGFSRTDSAYVASGFSRTDDGHVASGFSRTEQIAIPKSSNVEGGDLPPVRMVVD